MRTGMLCMALGIAGVAWLPQLPSPALLIAAAVALLAVASACWLRRHRARDDLTGRAGLALLALGFGVVWGCAYGYCIRSGLLPVELEQQSLLLQGRIDGLVEQRAGFARDGAAALPVLHFDFAIEAMAPGGRAAGTPFPRKIQLGWYEAAGAPQPGERWQLRVKLKRPRGFANPGGFDYEAWLVGNRIGATGHIERSFDNRRLAAAPRWSIDAWRGRAQHYLQRRLQPYAHRDLLLGLLLGDGSAITARQWDMFRATGTVHLFVVSGLQIAFTGGLALWLARLWWRSPCCVSRRRNHWLGALPALLIAWLYALLAGWGVPIQRALLMFAVLVWALLARRQLRAATGWIAALWLVLLCNPLAVRDMGFWFSFSAVAAILMIICGHRSVSRTALMQSAMRWWRVQWALFATSLPLVLLLSGQISWLALPANVIAIPLSTFLSLPLAFLALLVDALAPNAGDMIWRCADLSLDWLWRYLQWLQQRGAFDARHHWAIWSVPGVDIALCVFVALAALLLLLPHATPGRGFAALLLMPLCAPPLARIAPGHCAVTVIDVGQGLSVLVETARHRLLYDTGALFGPERSVAELTVAPLLRQRGIAALDVVVVSHNDSDHAGGWPALARAFAVQRLLVGEDIAPVADVVAEQCRAGMRWRWDDIDFEVLHPAEHSRSRMSGNNRSCVLQISAGGARILLTGDIERSAEYRLLDHAALQPVALLLAPHHGSRSSSTPALIERVRPAYVVFSTGYRNRFHHPGAEVVARYRHAGAELFDTAFTGAITFAFEPGRVAQISEWRSGRRHYWD